MLQSEACIKVGEKIEKSSSPEAPVFSRKTLHCRGADLLEPVE